MGSEDGVLRHSIALAQSAALPSHEFAGGHYHVASRGDRREDICFGDINRVARLETLDAACEDRHPLNAGQVAAAAGRSATDEEGMDAPNVRRLAEPAGTTTKARQAVAVDPPATGSAAGARRSDCAG